MAQVKDTTIKSDGSSILKKGSTLTSAASSPTDKIKQRQFYRSYASGLLDESRITDSGWKAIYEYQLENGLRDLSEIDTSVLKKYNVNTSLARLRVSEPIELETPNIEAGPTNPDVKETGFLGKLLQSLRTQNAPEQADRLRPITEEFGKQMEVTNQGLKDQIKNANAPYEGKDMRSLIQDKDPLLMALNNKLGNASMGEQVSSFLDSYRTKNNIKPNVAQNDGPSYLKGESKSNIDANNNGGYMPKSPMVNPLAAHTTQQTFKYDGKIEPALHFKLGQLNADLGAEYTKKMYGKPNRVEELTKEYQTLIEANPHLIESRINLDTNFWEFAAAGIEGTAQQAGMHSTYWGESAGSAALGATLGGVTALTLGNLGPQALTQVDDAVLLPYMMKKGAQLFAGAQSFENMFEIEAGLAYKDMLDQNIPEDRAKGYATLVGLINAGIEVNQLGDVIKSYPGLKQTLQGITKKGLEEATEKFVKKEGKHLIADYAKFVLGETGQEVVQEIVPIVATEKAKGRTISQSINALSTPENLGRMFDTAAQSIATFMFMGLGSVGTNIISTRSNNKNTQAVFDHMGRIESVVDKVSFRDFQDMGDDTKKTIFAYKGTLDTAIKNKLFDEEGAKRAQVLSDKIESLMVNKSVEKEEMEIINEKGHMKILPTFKSNLDALDITIKAVQNPTDEETQIAKENIDAFMADPKVQKLLTFFNGIDTKVPQGSINAKMAEFNTIYDNYFNREEESDIEGEILQNEAVVDVGQRRGSDEIINLDQQGQQGVQGPVPTPPSLEQPSLQTDGYSDVEKRAIENFISGNNDFYARMGDTPGQENAMRLATTMVDAIRNRDFAELNRRLSGDDETLSKTLFTEITGLPVLKKEGSRNVDISHTSMRALDPEAYDKHFGINETNIDDKLDDIEMPTEEEIIAEYEADNPKTLDEYLVSMASMHEKYSEEDKAALVEFTERMAKLNVDQMRKQGYEISDSNAEKWKMSYFENGAELLDAIRNRDFQELRERLADNSNKASRGLFTRITGLPTDNQTITFESIKKLDPEAYAKYEVDKKASQEEAKAKAAEEAKAAKEAEKAEKERLVGGNRMMWKGKAMDLSEMVQVLFDEGYRVTNQNDYGGYDISNGDDTFDKERLSKDERSYLKKHLLRLQQEEWDKADQEEWDSLTQEEQEANNHLFGTNIPTKADIAAKAESSSKTTEKDYETFFQETYNTIVNRMEADGEDSEIAESISGKAKDNAIEDIKSLVIRNINKLFYGKDIPLTENIRKMVDDQELYKVANRIYDEFNQLFETSIPTKTVTAVKAKYDSPYLNEMDPYSPSGVSVSEFLPYNKSGGNTIFKMGEYYTNGHFMIHDSALNSALRKRFEKYAEEKDQAATDRLMNIFSDTVSGMNDSKNDYVLPLLSDDNRVLAYEPETFSPMLYNTKYFNYIHNVLGLQIAFFGGDTKPSVLYKDHVPVGMLMPLRFGPDKPASDEIRQYIENSKKKSSDSTIKVEETKTEPERKPDFGYHAGDLGKAESFWRIKSGNRSTGHFGTGTYFVSNENKMVGVGFEDRPKHKIDFSNYKLYKPATWLESEALHDALKFINYNYSDIRSIEKMIEDSKQIEHIEEVMYEYDKAATLLAGEMNEEYLDVLKDFEKNGAVLKKFIDETPLLSEKDKKESMELAKNKYSNDGYILMAKYYGNLIGKIEDNLSSRGFAYEAIYDYESFQTNLERSHLDVSLDRAKEIMAYIASEVKMNLGDDWFNNEKSMSFDSPSTMFMKALGYEGVDVRHINSFDNTAYGSVIYDLKGKDAEYAQANKRQPIEDEPTESVPMGKAGESENTLTPADVIESMYEIIQGITDVSTFKIFEGLDEVVSDISDLDKNTDKQKIVLNELNKIVGEDKSKTLLDFLMSEVEFINNENDKELNGLNHPSTKIYLADIMESLEGDLEEAYDTDYEFFTSYSGDLFTIINDDDENVMGNIGTETAHDLVTSGKSRRSLYEEIKETIPDRNNYRIRMYNLIMNKAKQMAYGDTKEASNNAKALSDYGMSISEDSTKTGTKVWNVSGNTKDYKDILKRGVLGGNWYGPKKVWSFSQKQYPTIESLESAILEKISGMEVVENVEDTTTPPVSDTVETGYTIDEMTNIVRDRLKDIAPDGWKNGNLMKERTVRQQIVAILEKNGVPQEEQIDMAVKIFDTLKKEKDITDLISDVADEVVKDQKPKKPTYIFFNDLMEEMKDELSELGLADESEVDEIIEINDKVGIGAVNDLSTNYHQETGIKNMLNRVFDSEVADKIYEAILNKIKEKGDTKDDGRNNGVLGQRDDTEHSRPISSGASGGLSSGGGRRVGGTSSVDTSTDGDTRTGDLPIQQGATGTGSISSDETQNTKPEGTTGGKANVDDDSRVGQHGGDEADTSGDTTASSGKGRETPKINQNYKITGDDIFVGSGKVARYNSNVEALKTLIKVLKEGRVATSDEQRILAGYSGWGSIPEVFDTRNLAWVERRSELRTLTADIESLIPRERSYRTLFEDMSRSTTNAHYTDPKVIEQIYKALKKMGFKKGSILEPSMGTGYFFGAMPDSYRDKTRLYGVELEPVTGNIAKLLYPNADIRISGFEKAKHSDNYFDVAIGNVPFGQFGVTDSSYPDEITGLIHNYFFAKALDKVKEGGVVAFITSSGTMDNGKAIKKYISDRANLVAAIRMPAETFKEVAGTEVTTDLIIVQKRRKGELAKDTEWTKTGEVIVNEKTFSISKYFVDNPDMIIGDFVIDKLTGSRVGVSNRLGDTYERLADIVADKIPEGIFNPTKATVQETNLATEEFDFFKDGVDGAIIEKDGKLYQRADGKTIEIKENVAEIKKLQSIKQMVEELKSLQRLVDVDEKTLDTKRKALKAAYDSYVKQYGKLLVKKTQRSRKTGLLTLVGNYRVDEVLGYRKKKGKTTVLIKDPESHILKSLEIEEVTQDKKGNDVQVITPSKILTERTITPRKPKEKVDSAEEGLIQSINYIGGVDVGYISKIYGKPEETVVKELGGRIFFNPQTSEYETLDAYLSGDVRTKLKQAELLVDSDPSLQRNIDELKKVLPEDVEFKDISIRTGDSWVPLSVTKKIVYSILGITGYQQERLTIEYLPASSKWKIEGKKLNENSTMTRLKAGIPKTALQIVETALNNGNTRITAKDYDGKTVELTMESNAYKAKVEEIRAYAKQWLVENPEEMRKVVDAYNEKMNNIARRDYTQLADMYDFSSMNQDVSLRPHQKVAIVRGIYGGNTLLAHGVGAGKTFAEIAIAVEAKRLGLANKPVVVVPNTKLVDFENDAKRLYPGINILALDADDFNTDNIKQTLSLAATNNWDLVLIRHSSFTKIPLSPDTQLPFLMDLRRQWSEVLREAKNERGGNRFSVKDIEAKLADIDLKIAAFETNRELYEGMGTFESLGFDFLVVDESHEFKNFPIAGTQTNIKGVHTGESSQAIDMYMKARYVSGLHNGKRGVVFATGTPITNSMAESYVNFMFLRPDLFEDIGIRTFDEWISAFAEIKLEAEIKASGDIKQTKMFTQFTNLPELITKFKEFADIVFTEDLDYLPLPDYELIKVECEPHPELKEITDFVQDNYADYAKNKRLFKLLNMAKQAPIDIRLVKKGATNHTGSKLNRTVNNVHQIWKDRKAEKATQLIFINRGTSTENEFSLWDATKEELIKKGIPENEITIISGKTKESDLEEIYKLINAGIIRVAIGSYDKMGVGINVQERLYAIHEIDVPMRPAELEQAEGRIIRQGNSYYDKGEAVKIYRYVTVGENGTFSADAWSWQMVERKLKNTNAAMRGERDILSISEDDDVELMIQLKAAALNDERFFKYSDIEKAMQMMDAEFFAFQRSKGDAKYELDRSRAALQRASDILYVRESAKKSIDKSTDADLKVGRDKMPLSTVEERAAANQGIKDYIKSHTQPQFEYKIQIGEYKGMYLHYIFKEYETKDWYGNVAAEHIVASTNQYYADLDKDMVIYSSKLEQKKDTIANNETYDILRALNTKFNGIDNDIAKYKDTIQELNENIKGYQETAKLVFQKENQAKYLKHMYRALSVALGFNQGVNSTFNTISDAAAYYEASSEDDYIMFNEIMDEELELIKEYRESGNKPSEYLTERIDDLLARAVEAFDYERRKEAAKQKKAVKTESLTSKRNERKANPSIKAHAGTATAGKVSQGPKNVTRDKVRPISDIIKDIERDLSISISSKRYRAPRPGAAGYFNVRTHGIRIKVDNNINVISHEVGHYLDKKYEFSEKYEKELRAFKDKYPIIANYNDDEVPSEVFAEFIREYLTTEDNAKKSSPEFYKIFVDTFKSDDVDILNDWKMLNKHKKDITDWFKSTTRDRVKSTQKSHTEKKKRVMSEEAIKAEMYLFDDLAPIKALTERVEEMTGQKIKVSDNPYVLALNTRRAGMIAKNIILNGLTDTKGEIIGKSMKEVLSGINRDDMDEFDAYLKARHAVTLNDYDIRVFSDEFDMADILELVEEYEEEFPEFIEIADELYQWWGAFIEEWVVKPGFMSEEAWQDLQARYPTYVPNFRVMDDKTRGTWAKRGFGNQHSPIKKIKGSAKDTYSVIESMMLYADKIVKVQKRNETGQAVHKLYNTVEGLSEYLEKVAPESEKHKFNAMGLKETLLFELATEFESKLDNSDKAKASTIKVLGDYNKYIAFLISKGFTADVIIDNTIDDIITYFTTKSFSTDSTVFTVVDEYGNSHFYYSKDLLFLEAMLNIDGRKMDDFVMLLGGMKRVFTTLTTGANPMFALFSNIWADVPEAMVYGDYKNPFEFGKALFKAMADTAVHLQKQYRHKNTYENYGNWGSEAKAYKAMGGGFSSQISDQRNLMTEMLNSVFPDMKKSSLKAMAEYAIELVEQFNDTIETAPRLAIYNKAIQEYGDTYESRLLAMYKASEATTNFLRRGKMHYTAIGQGVPFLNAGLQGLYKLNREFGSMKGVDKNDITAGGKRVRDMKAFRSVLAKALLYVTLFEVSQMIAYDDDDDYKNLPEYTKDGYYLFKIGDGKFFKIRKPRALSILFGSSFRRGFMSIAKGDEKAWEGFKESFMNIVMPPNPLTDNIFSPLIQAYANKSWTGAPIVSKGMEYGKKSDQFDTNTTEIAKFIARGLSDKFGIEVSPKKMDYVFQQYSGVIGQFAIPMMSKNKTVAGMFQQKMVADVAFSNDLISSFYDTKTALDEVYSSYNKSGRISKDFDPVKRYRYGKVAEELSLLYDQIDEVKANLGLTPKEKQTQERDIRKKMLELTSEENLKPTSFDEFKVLYNRGSDITSKYKKQYAETGIKPNYTEDEAVLLNMYNIKVQDGRSELGYVNYQAGQIDKRIDEIQAKNTIPEAQKNAAIKKLEETKKKLTDDYMAYYKKNYGIDIVDFFK